LGIQNLYTIEGFIFLILCSAVSLSIKMKSIQERLILLEEEFNLKLSEEVLYKTKKINEQKEMLETSNILKDKLFSILAHELRSPMQNLLEVTEIFKEKKMNRSYLDKFMKSVSLDIYNNKYILENLLFWTSSQFKEEKIRIESIHIISLIKELILLFDKNIHKKKLKITLLQKKAIYCQADKSILRLVLSNFFSNSIKYSNFKDEIIFDCQIYQSECRIILKDTGIGIEESKLDLIRKGLPIDSNLGTKNEKGLGIGLHICKHYLNKMNTDFTIESKLGQGTEISFILPLKIYE
jgi:signal transduction histidine kinase